MNERNELLSQEDQIMNLFDRQNSILRGYENRLQQMKRILDEQEMQIHRSHEALQEAMREIAQLKKL